MTVLLRCLGCSAGAFAYMWVFQWRHYRKGGKFNKDQGSE